MTDASDPHFDIVIVCAVHDTELEKVLQTGKEEWKSFPAVNDDPGSYHQTTFSTISNHPLRVIAAAPTQMGMPASAVLATKMIRRFRPRLVAMVGIAAGAKSDKQKYGNILAPNQTFDYNAGKLTIRDGKLHFEPAPDPLRISERMRGRLQEWATNRTKLDEISSRWPIRNQRTHLDIHIGPMGSGAAVIDAAQPVLDVIEHRRKLVGVEMEAYGVHLACQNALHPAPEFLCLKSISDFAAGKTDEWRDYAAYTAAELCYSFVTEEWDTLFPR